MTAKNSSHGGIRITSDPDSTRVEQSESEARKRTDLPLRMLFAANLTPQGDLNYERSECIRRVDKHTFAEVFDDLAPKLEFEVPNRLSDAPQLIDLTLRIRSLDDFRPHRLAEQIPVLAPLLEARTLVARLKAKEIGLDTFRDELVARGIDSDWAGELYETLSAGTASSPPAEHGEHESVSGRGPDGNQPNPDGERRKNPGSSGAPSGSSEDEALERLFSLVDSGESASDGGEAADQTDLVGSLMDAVTGTSSSGAKSSGRKVEPTTADVLLDDLDRTIGRQLNAVLSHPRMRDFEAAWRGLKFLVDRLDFRAGIQLEILPVAKSDVDDALYHQVLVPAHEAESGPSMSLIVLGFTFDSTQNDIALLEELAATAASLQLPVVGSVDPHFFEIEHESGLERLPPLWQHLESPQYILWNKFRRSDEAGNLALALPSFLLRYPQGDDSKNGRFTFSEDGYLWGGAGLLVATAAAKSFSDVGWPTHLTQYKIEDLPVWVDDAGAKPLAVSLSTARMSELAASGFVTLGCELGRDSARVMHAPTSLQTPRGDDRNDAGATAHASLSCRLFLARFADFLLSLEERLIEDDRESTAENTIAYVKAAIEAFLGVRGEEAIEIEPLVGSAEPSSKALRIRVVPPPDVLDPPIPLVFALPFLSSGKTAI